MTTHQIGEVSLTFSTSLYFVWLLPQLYHNFKRQSTEGLSFWLHSLLLLGYLHDLIYGFGLDMAWQYRAVTLVGLLSLAIQHWQFARYHSASPPHSYPRGYRLLTSAACLLLGVALYVMIKTPPLPRYYDQAGFIANACYLCYLLPQIQHQYKQKTTNGLSYWFVALSILLDLCDLVSAYTLSWHWPSLLGSLACLSFKFILVGQLLAFELRSLGCDQL